MKDYIVRATAGDGQIRAFAATTGNLVEEARKRHDTSPVATAALGRLLTAGAMMGGMMKNETDVLTLQIKGDGPLGGITVTADAKGDVKGYVDHPEAMMPPKNGKLDVGGAVGIGLLNVIKDMGLKEPYVGQTILQTSEIAEDLTYYFATSEQVPSSVGLGVLMNKDNTVHCAGGFIVQVMPFISDEVLDKLEENIKKISSVTSMLDNGHTPEQMLEQVLDGLNVEFIQNIRCLTIYLARSFRYVFFSCDFIFQICICNCRTDRICIWIFMSDHIYFLWFFLIHFILLHYYPLFLYFSECHFFYCSSTLVRIKDHLQ